MEASDVSSFMAYEKPTANLERDKVRALEELSAAGKPKHILEVVQKRPWIPRKPLELIQSFKSSDEEESSEFLQSTCPTAGIRDS